ncbi:inactive protein RESTRICTED TEV MOVEMENT 2-like [Juglans microcarpa x Juglans regia]|uniref:inactive protein RESTRICTED TEV MOVEMENT 2-like n=1 Tax=Juglans microcarpa x Juglans regia TaxID=2249226 RepID=UPI001B7E9CA5|nr:inactive protein RESTRICTED TEV MOVEMENT 2-like [Juglans microcarpa x Juglans regia]
MQHPMENNDRCSTQNRCYIDFEPYCKWRRNEKIKRDNSRDGKIKQDLGDILEIHLHGFKRKQLKASVHGKTLKLTGETELDENTWRRFSKEVDISKDYQTDKIKAKFSRGVLSLTMPKKVPLLRQALEQLGQEGFLWKMEMSMKKLVTIALAVFLGMAVAYLVSSFSSRQRV